MDYAQLEDSAPEDYSSQSDGDTEGNESSSNIRYIFKYNSIYNDKDFNWKQIYLIPHKVTLDIRTRIFQYKLSYRTLLWVRIVKSMKNSSSICSYTVNSAKTFGAISFLVEWFKYYNLRAKG